MKYKSAFVSTFALLTLTIVATAHPALRFVDQIRFSERAQRLLEGRELLDGLYPVGYAALLAAAHALGGDVLLVGKAASVLAGVGAVWAAARFLGPAVALWMLAQTAFVAWGSTEGTDMPAAALSLGAVAAAHAGRGGVAGALLGLACLTRYTAAAALPAVLLATPAGERRAVLLAAFLVTAPHWATAAILGRSPLPSQEQNLLIGAGHPAALLSLDTLLRWPAGFGRSLLHAAPDWPTRVAALGLVVGLVRRDRRAAILALLVASHCALVGLAFANPRLALPAGLAITLGLFWLIPSKGVALAGVGLLALHLPAARRADSQERARGELAAACATLEGAFVTNSPWFYARREGWLTGGIQLYGLAHPRGLTPATLRTAVLGTGAGHVVLEVGRVKRDTPGLLGLVTAETDGFVPAAHAPGWRVYAVP